MVTLQDTNFVVHRYNMYEKKISSERYSIERDIFSKPPNIFYSFNMMVRKVDDIFALCFKSI